MPFSTGEGSTLNKKQAHQGKKGARQHECAKAGVVKYREADRAAQSERAIHRRSGPRHDTAGAWRPHQADPPGMHPDDRHALADAKQETTCEQKTQLQGRGERFPTCQDANKARSDIQAETDPHTGASAMLVSIHSGMVACQDCGKKSDADTEPAPHIGEAELQRHELGNNRQRQRDGHVGKKEGGGEADEKSGSVILCREGG